MLKRFFEDYKMLEGKRVDVEEILPMEAAHAVIEQAISDYWTERQRLAAPGVRGQR
jgi:inorganic pyrophosphatase